MTAAVIVLSILILVLVAFVVKRFLFAGTDGIDLGLQVDTTPFAKLRGRSIVLRGVLAFISTVIITSAEHTRRVSVVVVGGRIGARNQRTVGCQIRQTPYSNGKLARSVYRRRTR